MNDDVPAGVRPVLPDDGPPAGLNRAEYTLLHDNGNDEPWLAERPCGCVHLFDSVEDMLAYYSLEVTDTIVCRTVTQWKPWEGQL